MTWPPARPGRRAGFTLLELIVAMAVLAVMLAIVAQIVADARNVWSRSVARVSQFRDARLAFELITRNVSQAGLNTYFDYEYGAGGATVAAPERYVRNSELHFLTGQTGSDAPDGLLIEGPGKDIRPGHCIFFQAYLGHSLDSDLDNLGNLLNGRGYYLQFTDGTELAPKFLAATVPQRWRYRLWEWMPASEDNAIYASGTREWFETEARLGWGAGNNDGTSRLVAENIIALLISPRASLPEPGDASDFADAVSIAPEYAFDSRSHGPTTSPARFGPNPPLVSMQHLLPPLVQITLVAIDENSAQRLESGATPPDFLYDSGAGLASAFENAADYEDDLQALEDSLNEKNISYRVFSATVALRGAKWDASAFSQR